MKYYIRVVIAFLIIWFTSGICFYLHGQGNHLYAYLVALISLIAFPLLSSKNTKSDKETID